jgi:hypothetical protein
MEHLILQLFLDAQWAGTAEHRYLDWLQRFSDVLRHYLSGVACELSLVSDGHATKAPLVFLAAHVSRQVFICHLMHMSIH